MRVTNKHNNTATLPRQNQQPRTTPSTEAGPSETTTLNQIPATELRHAATEELTALTKTEKLDDKPSTSSDAGPSEKKSPDDQLSTSSEAGPSETAIEAQPPTEKTTPTGKAAELVPVPLTSGEPPQVTINTTTEMIPNDRDAAFPIGLLSKDLLEFIAKKVITSTQLPSKPLCLATVCRPFYHATKNPMVTKAMTMGEADTQAKALLTNEEQTRLQSIGTRLGLKLPNEEALSSVHAFHQFKDNLHHIYKDTLNLVSTEQMAEFSHLSEEEAITDFFNRLNQSSIDPTRKCQLAVFYMRFVQPKNDSFALRDFTDAELTYLRAQSIALRSGVKDTRGNEHIHNSNRFFLSNYKNIQFSPSNLKELLVKVARPAIVLENETNEHPMIPQLRNKLLTEANGLSTKEPLVISEAARFLSNFLHSSETRIAILQGGGIPPLITVLEDENSEVRQQVSQFLLRVAITDQTIQRFLETRLQNENAEIRQQAISIIIGLSNPDRNVGIREAMPHLVAMLQNENAAVRQQSMSILKSLIKAETRSAIIEGGAIPPLVAILENAGERERAAGVLSRLVSDEWNVQRPLIVILQNESTEVRQQAIGIFRSLLNPDRSVGHREAIPPLITMLENETVRIQVARILGWLSNAETSAAIAEAIPHLKTILQHENNEDIRVAAEVIEKLTANIECRARMIEEGIVPILVNLLKNSDEATVRAVLHALKGLIVDQSYITPMVKETAIPLLVLFSDEDEAREILQTLDPEISQTILELEGKAPYLINLLSHEHPIIRRRAAFVIKKLLIGPKSKAIICQKGAIPPLAMMLQNGNALEIISAAEVIEGLTVDIEEELAATILAEIKKARVWAILVNRLKENDISLTASVCASLHALTKNTVNRSEIIDAGAIPILINLLENFENSILCENAKGLLINLMTDHNNEAVMQHIDSLVRLLNHPQAHTKSAAIYILGALADNPATNQAMIDAGVFPLLINLLKNDDKMIKSEVLRTLEQFLINSQSIAAMIDANVMTHLVGMLKDSQWTIAEKAKTIIKELAHLSVDPKSKTTIIQSVILPLVDCLKDDDISIRNNALEIFGDLAAVNEESKSAMIDAGAIPLLVLLSNEDGSSYDLNDQRKNAKKTLQLLDPQAWEKTTVNQIPYLVPLLSHENPIIRIKATGVLSNIRPSDEDGETNLDIRQAILKEGAITPVVNMLKNGDNKEKCRAASLLLSIQSDTDEKTRTEIILAGAIPPLVGLLQFVHERSTTRNIALSSLMRLMNSNDGTYDQIVTEGAVPHLVALLEDENERAWSNEVATMIGKLSDFVEVRQAMLQKDAISSLLTMVRSEHEYQRKSAIHTLNNLASDESFREAVVAHCITTNAITTLVNLGLNCELFKKTISNPSVQARIHIGEADTQAKAMLTVEQRDQLEPIITMLGLELPVEKHFSSFEDFQAYKINLQHIYEDTLTAMGNEQVPALNTLSEEEAIKTIFKNLCNRYYGYGYRTSTNPGSLVAFYMTHAQGESTKRSLVREAAAKTLESQISSIYDCDNYSKGIPPLVTSLRDTSERVRAAAVHTLSHFIRPRPDEYTVNKATIPMIVQAGGIYNLVPLLRDKSENIRIDAANILLKIVYFHDDTVTKNYIAQMIEANAIPSLVSMLSDGHSENEKRIAAEVLSLLTSDSKTSNAVLEAGGIPYLVTMLGDKNKWVKKAAVEALSNLEKFPVPRAAIIRTGAIPPLIGLLNESGYDRSSLCALNYLTSNPEGSAAMIEAGAIPLLVLLSSDENHTVREQANTLLASLDIEVSQAIQQVKEKLPYLIGLLRSGNASVRNKVITILETLSKDTKSKTMIGQAGAIPILVELLKDESVNNASSLLLKLASEAKNRTEIINAGAIPPLVHMLTRNQRDYRNDTHSVFKLLVNHDGAKVRPLAIPPLVNFLRNSIDYDNYNERCKAIIILKDFSKYTKSRTEIIDAGAIPILENIGNHGMLSPIAKEILKKLRLEKPRQYMTFLTKRLKKCRSTRFRS